MTPEITLLTQPPFPIPDKGNPHSHIYQYIKYLLRLTQSKPLPIQINGPGVVYTNLEKGLEKIGYSTKVNPPIWAVNSDVGVLSNIDALTWAIRAKKNGRISYLVAGPNLVLTPDDHEKILISPEIDKIVVPCQWVKDLYTSVAPSIQNRLYIWPVGIDTDKLSSLKEQEQNMIVVYQKNAPDEIFNAVLAKLKQVGQEYKVLFYGQYAHEEYLALLKKAKALIFLSQSESQGIALFEAWSYDVPVLAWDRGYWVSTDGTRRWDGASSAPYLTSQSGMRFMNSQDFTKVFPFFMESLGSFSPREYVLQNFTLEICAQRYLSLFPTSAS